MKLPPNTRNTASLDDLNTGVISILDRDGHLRFVISFANRLTDGAIIADVTAREELGCVVARTETVAPALDQGAVAFLAADRLEALRAALRAESISYDELAELQSLAAYIAPGDVELREAAGVPEHDDDDDDAPDHLSHIMGRPR